MNKKEFFNFIVETFELDGAAQRLIHNILDYIERTTCDENEQYLMACDLLDGTIGLTDTELRPIAF